MRRCGGSGKGEKGGDWKSLGSEHVASPTHSGSNYSTRKKNKNNEFGIHRLISNADGLFGVKLNEGREKKRESKRNEAIKITVSLCGICT